MVPNDPHLLVFKPLCNFLQLTVSWTFDLLLTNRIWQKGVSLLRLGHKRLQRLSVLGTLSLRLLTRGEAGCHFMGTLGEPSGETHWARTWRLQATAECMSLLGSRSIRAIRGFSLGRQLDCNLERDWAKPSELRCSGLMIFRNCVTWYVFVVFSCLVCGNLLHSNR